MPVGLCFVLKYVPSILAHDSLTVTPGYNDTTYSAPLMLL